MFLLRYLMQQLKNQLLTGWQQEEYMKVGGQHQEIGRGLNNIFKVFQYMKKLGIEESIELVASYLMNAEGLPRFFVNGDIAVNDKGDLFISRLENYVRDEETHKPIDDEVVTHITDCVRYFVANKVRGDIGGEFTQK